MGGIDGKFINFIYWILEGGKVEDGDIFGREGVLCFGDLRMEVDN